MRIVPRLLVVDADDTFATTLCRWFVAKGYAAESVSSAQAALERLDARCFALVVLDLGLGGLDVASLVAAPRGLITLSRRADLLERVVSLELGADDSLSKPVCLQELMARVRAVLRCPGRIPPAPPTSATTRFDGWELQRRSRQVTPPTGIPVRLSNSEFALLTALLETPRQVVRRDRLMSRVGTGERRTPGRSVDLLVSRLRHKLGAVDGEPGPIRTVRGAGYLLDIRSLAG